ncbi:MAG: YHS domain-containing protein [Ignavibacteriaceae bacterium]|nr:YHS domain-containing protein [Ignavibacteriaceae bacterium]
MLNLIKIASVFLFLFIAGSTVSYAQHHSEDKNKKENHEGMKNACCADKENCCGEGKKCCEEKKPCCEDKSCCTNKSDKGCCGEGKSCCTDKGNTEAQAKVIFNSVCPVAGDEIDAEGPTVEYKGKVYAFCCPGCDKKFQKDPEKYLKNLSEDGKTFIGKK